MELSCSESSPICKFHLILSNTCILIVPKKVFPREVTVVFDAIVRLVGISARAVNTPSREKGERK